MPKFEQNRGPKATTHKTEIRAANSFSIKIFLVSNHGSRYVETGYSEV
jgi:hypothetical protein